MNKKLLKTIKFVLVFLLFTILLYCIYVLYLKALQLLNKHSYSCFSWNAFPPHYLFQSYKMVLYYLALCNILSYVVYCDVIHHKIYRKLLIENNIVKQFVFKEISELTYVFYLAFRNLYVMICVSRS